MRWVAARRRFWHKLAGVATVTSLLAGAAVAVSWAGTRALADETTISADTLRTGWDQNESGLAPAQVSSANFGQLFSTAVNGQVYAQPIVAGSTVVVATENNYAYGLDSATGAIKWSVNFGPSWPAATIGCGDLTPNIGVTSTPVYDPGTGTVYFTAKVNDGADAQHPHWYLHALNAQTGTEQPGWPVTIQGSPSNDPTRTFDPYSQAQRPGLLLMGGSVYAAFGSYCDFGSYAGYVVGVNTATKAESLWTDEAGTSSHMAGIWQSGGGLVSDGAGRIFFASGNGVSPPVAAGSPVPSELAESVVRLGVAANGTISAQDFFSPSNAPTLDTNDQDLASGGPVALPASFGTSTYPNLMVQVGKDGRVFLLNRDNLGGRGQGSGGGDAVVGTIGPIEGVWGHPAVWGGDGGYLYVVGSGGPLRALKYGLTSAGLPTFSEAGNSNASFPYTSGSPIVTSTGTTSGTAMVWEIQTSGPSGASGQLMAYNALPANGTLQLVRSFPLGTVSKFAVPAADGGRVYVGTRDGHVLGFGQPTTAALTAQPFSFGSVNVGSTATGTLTMTATKTVTVSAVSAAAPFSASAGTLPVTLTSGQTLAVPVTFTPAAAGSAVGTVSLSTDSGTVAVNLSGTGVRPGFSPVTSTLSFGTVPVGTSKTLSVSFTNSGTTAETVTAATAPTGPFAAAGMPAVGTVVNPGVSIAVPVTFTPTAAGTDTSTVTLTGADGSSTYTLTGTAVTGTATLSLTPTSLDFGNVTVGQTASLTLTASNTGNIPLMITKAASPAAPFTVTNPIPEGLTLSPGTTVTATVTFTPTAAGAFSGIYEVTSNSGQGAMQVAVTGTGVTAPAAVPAPGSGWTLNGSAAMSGTDLNLTPAVTYAAGSAVYPNAVVSNGLQATFTAQIGGGTGSAGLTFAMLDPAHSTARSLGVNGGGLGFSGLTGVAVALQTTWSAAVGSSNFIGVSTGGTKDSLTFVKTATNVPALRTGTHLIAVAVSNGVLMVSVDGTQVISTAVTLPATVYPAFTGSTGSRTDVHTVRNVAITGGSGTAPPPPPPPPPPVTGVLPAPGGAGWTYNKSAAMSGTDLVLTPAVQFAAGSAFNSQVLPTAHLHATFTAQIGGGTGGTGQCFAILDSTKSAPTAVGHNGGGDGFSGLTGVAVCLQTHQSTGDPSANFVGITAGGVNDLLTYVSTSTNIGPLRTGTHLVDVQVNAAGQLVVAVDGTTVLTTAVTLPVNAIVGFTGSTGASTDIHLVRAVTITY